MEAKETIRVLIVDDQELMRQSLSMLLSTREEIQVTDCVENGLLAIKSVRDNPPDVILMDVRMPEMDGVQATRIIHENRPDIKIIILTTFDDDDYVFSALSYGASGYLLKGISVQELVDAIHTVYQGGSLMNPDVASKVLAQFSRMAQGGRGAMPGGQLASLSLVEKQICREVGLGHSTREVAARLYLSEGTVRNYISALLGKLGFKNRTQLAVWALQSGLIADDSE